MEKRFTQTHVDLLAELADTFGETLQHMPTVVDLGSSDEVVFLDRMHLSYRKIRGLCASLQEWVDKGTLPKATSHQPHNKEVRR